MKVDADLYDGLGPSTRLVAGQPLDRLRRSSCPTTCTRPWSIRWRRARRPRSPTAAATSPSRASTASGDYLYFTACTNVGPGSGWLDMSSLGRPSTAVYVMVLRKDLASPIAPESDEEAKGRQGKAIRRRRRQGGRRRRGGQAQGGRGQGQGADKDAAPGQASGPHRLRPPRPAHPRPADRPGELHRPRGGHDGRGVHRGRAHRALRRRHPERRAPPDVTVSRFDLKTRKNEKLARGRGRRAASSVSADGEKMLYAQGQSWFVDRRRQGAQGAATAR